MNQNPLEVQTQGEVAAARRESCARVKSQVAAEILGVSIRTLEDWRAKGKGPRFIRIGRRLIRYDVSDLRAYLEEQKSPDLLPQ